MGSWLPAPVLPASCARPPSGGISSLPIQLPAAFNIPPLPANQSCNHLPRRDDPAEHLHLAVRLLQVRVVEDVLQCRVAGESPNELAVGLDGY